MKTIYKAMDRVVRLSVIVALLCGISLQAKTVEILNVSYDPTREFYVQFNEAFSAYWKEKTGDDVVVKQSHGGSGKQARAILDGLQGDVATLGLAYDINALAEKGRLLPEEWQKRLPNNSSPYTSAIVLLVRKGNPKGIHDFEDLARPGISVVTANPKTSGGARWNFLAAWGYALKKRGGDKAKARAFVAAIYKNTPVLDTGARGATTTFVERGIGDVLISWENEALLILNGKDKAEFAMVVPSTTILAEPPVAWLDRNVRRHGTEAVSKAYLEFLYTEKGQEIAARNYYRPRNPKVTAQFVAQFPATQLFTSQDLFGEWNNIQKTYFAEGGVFDEIQRDNR